MNSKNGRCRASMNYDNVHEKCPKKPCTRFCTRFCGANMALYDTIKHYGQSDNQAFKALWSVMALYKTGGYASSLSAINIENQWFAKFVHENVHETPDFTPISGVFRVFFGRFGNGNRVQQKNEARRQNRASTLFPGDEPGLSQQCGCKGTNFIPKSFAMRQECCVTMWKSVFGNAKATQERQ